MENLSNRTFEKGGQGVMFGLKFIYKINIKLKDIRCSNGNLEVLETKKNSINLNVWYN